MLSWHESTANDEKDFKECTKPCAGTTRPLVLSEFEHFDASETQGEVLFLRLRSEASKLQLPLSQTGLYRSVPAGGNPCP